MKYAAYGYEHGRKHRIGTYESEHPQKLRDAVRAGHLMDLDSYGFRVLTLECDGVEVDESSPGNACSHESLHI